MLAVVALLALLCASPGQDADSIWQALRQRYVGLRTLSGRFTETLGSGLDEPDRTFTGSFSVRLPADYRLEVEAPESQLIVGNDTVLWFHFPGQRRAVRQAHGQAIPLLAFLEPLLDPTTSARLDPTSDNRVRLEVNQPDTMLASMFDLVFELDAAANRIERFSFTDAWESRYSFVLTSQQWNPDLDDRLFIFSPPPGTEIEGSDAGP